MNGKTNPVSKSLKLFNDFELMFVEDPISGLDEYVLRDAGKIVSRTFDGVSHLYFVNVNDKNIVDVHEISSRLVREDMAGLVSFCHKRKVMNRLSSSNNLFIKKD